MTTDYLAVKLLGLACRFLWNSALVASDGMATDFLVVRLLGLV